MQNINICIHVYILHTYVSIIIHASIQFHLVSPLYVWGFS